MVQHDSLERLTNRLTYLDPPLICVLDYGNCWFKGLADH